MPIMSTNHDAAWRGEVDSLGRHGYASVNMIDDRGDDAGRTGWTWSLETYDRGMVVTSCRAMSSDLIYSHDEDPRAVLHVLASFVDAMRESMDYERRGNSPSENRHLFGLAAEPFVESYAEEFFCETMPEEVDA